MKILYSLVFQSPPLVKGYCRWKEDQGIKEGSEGNLDLVVFFTTQVCIFFTVFDGLFHVRLGKG